MIYQILLISLNDNEKEYVDKLHREVSQKDESVKVFDLDDVENNRRYSKQASSFSKKLKKCLGDCNRIFLVLSDDMEKAVEKNEFSNKCPFEDNESRGVFGELLNQERPYAEEGRSKIVLVDLFNNANVPGSLRHFEVVKNLFTGEREAARINDEVLDVILSKCKLIRQDAAPQGNQNNCTIH